MVDMSPHVSAVFKELFEEIKSAKQQQWTITNYGVLILAAIYAVGHQLPAGVTHLHSKLKFLAILAVAIAVVGSYFLLRIQSHMERSRHRSDKLHKTYFTPNELRDIGLTDDEINNLGDENDLQGKRWWRSANWWRGLEFAGPLIFVLWIGAALVCVALWWSVKP
jgi:membrane protein implicated in regulation of membrane protease activity